MQLSVKRLISALKKLDLSGQEIADVLWFAAKTDNGFEPLEVEVEPEPSPDESLPRDELPPQPTRASRVPEKQAEIVPLPPKQSSSLTLPPNYKPIAIPDAPSFSQALGLARALRPLARKIAVGLPKILDEEATVERIAQTGVWQPILKAESELWLDLAFVFDTSPSMCIWKRLSYDLKRLLANYGEFRDVRFWYLQPQANQVELTNWNRKVYKPHDILTGEQRRLIVIVSDCVGEAWHNGTMRELISAWSARLPTVLFHVFPERLWSRTALTRSLQVEFKANQPGIPSNKLVPFAQSIWDRERLSVSRNNTEVRLPVVSIERDSLASWAKVVAGVQSARVLGIIWDAEPVSNHPQNKPASEPSEQAEQLSKKLDTFFLTAAPTSRELAKLLSAAPVITLPIVRLIQQSMLPRHQAIHIAEVLMSGLFRVSGNQVPNLENAERIVYELVDDQVRSQLGASSNADDTLTVLTKVSEHISETLNMSVSTFWGYLRSPQEAGDQPQAEFLNAFATVSAKILRRLGKEFTALADSLTSTTPTALPQKQSIEESPFPPLTEFEFIEAHFVYDENSPEFPPSLQTGTFTVLALEPEQPTTLETFEFTVATLANRQGTWAIQRQQQSAQKYSEALSNNIALEMIAIPGGTFLMGSPKSELEHYEDESPQHKVFIEPFFMGRYPITQAQWRIVANLPQVEQELESEPSHFKGENKPVEQVSWYASVEFCARLSAYTGREYRLSTEAEWEYACRAGSTTPFYFGDIITTDVSNYDGSAYADSLQGQDRGETTPIDHFGFANDFGLSDMHGNVYEWCQDHWHSNYHGAPTTGRAWLTENKKARRVRRGGSWASAPRYCRSAYRYSYFPYDRYSLLGFRIVCSTSKTFQ